MKTNSVHSLQLIAACGLYCGCCGKYIKNRCPGCLENSKASWCKIRSCCIEKGITNCSACKEYSDPMNCRKYNSFIGKVIGLLTGTDRSKCIEYIKINGTEKFMIIMATSGRMSMPRIDKKA